MKRVRLAGIYAKDDY